MNPAKNDFWSRLVINLTGSVIGMAMVGAFWFLLVELFKVPVPSANHDVLLVVIGALLREVGNISTYFFTGDANARKQADTIASQASTIAQTASSGGSTSTVTLGPGDQATTTATDAGTTIHKEDSP